MFDFQKYICSALFDVDTARNWYDDEENYCREISAKQYSIRVFYGESYWWGWCSWVGCGVSQSVVWYSYDAQKVTGWWHVIHGFLPDFSAFESAILVGRDYLYFTVPSTARTGITFTFETDVDSINNSAYSNDTSRMVYIELQKTTLQLRRWSLLKLSEHGIRLFILVSQVQYVSNYNSLSSLADISCNILTVLQYIYITDVAQEIIYQ